MRDRSLFGVFARRNARPQPTGPRHAPEPPAGTEDEEDLLWLALQHRMAMRAGGIRKSGGRRLADDVIVARLLRRA